MFEPRTATCRPVSYTHLCVIFEPRTAAGRSRTSDKVPFAPSHRPVQDSMVKNQNSLTDYEPAINNPKNWSNTL